MQPAYIIRQIIRHDTVTGGTDIAGPSAVFRREPVIRHNPVTGCLPEKFGDLSDTKGSLHFIKHIICDLHKLCHGRLL